MAIIKNTIGTLEYLTAEGIATPHCFTTRLGGVSAGALASLNIGAHRGDEEAHVAENFRILGTAIGFHTDAVVLTRQIHTDIVRTVTKADHITLDHHDYPACDALISNDPGVALVVFTADCTPILLYDPVTGAIGAAHAGWRGTAADIAGKTVEKMVAEFGCRPKDIRAAIGPNLDVCCFETDADVPLAMEQTFGRDVEPYILPRDQKFYVNLKAINAYSLRRRGVEHIEISIDCTMCHHETYWSHRFTRGLRGSQGAIICRKET